MAENGARPGNARIARCNSMQMHEPYNCTYPRLNAITYVDNYHLYARSILHHGIMFNCGFDDNYEWNNEIKCSLTVNYGAAQIGLRVAIVSPAFHVFTICTRQVLYGIKRSREYLNRLHAVSLSLSGTRLLRKMWEQMKMLFIYILWHAIWRSVP